MLGMGLPVPVLSLVGLAGILALKVSDPAQWMTRLGGPLFGASALLFVLAANVGATTAGIYASTVGLKGVPCLRRLSWNAALLASLAPVCVVGVFFAGWYFEHFGSFLAYLGVAFAPLVGVQVVDHFVLRGQRISIRGIYEKDPDGPYGYWFGVNPAALAALAAGVVTYLYLLDPLTYATREPFSWVGASLPAAAVAASVHVVLTVLVVRPAGRGGYRGWRAQSSAPAATVVHSQPVPSPSRSSLLE
jgi:nucleobase:cation symporter-1, NCS1 family